MARKDINVGLTGNDGTGDSIRDAFSKVNSNFQELYSSQGLEAGLTLANLVDVVKPLKPTAVLTLDNLGENVLNKFLIADNSGIRIDSESDPENIIFSLERIRISDDTDPTLSNVLNASAFRLTNVANPAEDQDATTRKWVYQNFLNRDNIDLLGSVPNANGSTMRANFKIAPSPDNGNPNAGNQIISVKGSDGVVNKTDVFLKYQGTDPAHATRKDYVDTKLSLQGTDTRDPATGNINQGFGVMTGPLVLNDHPAPYVGILKKPDSTGSLFAQQDYRAATKGYVDSNVYNSPNNIYVSTIGNDEMWDFENDRPNPDYGYPEKEVGRSWSKAFKTVRQAARFAKKYIDRVSLSNTPLQVTPNLIQRWVPPNTTALSSPRTRVRVSIQDHGFYDGDYVVVGGAILGSLDTRALNGIHRVNRVDANIFELNLNQVINWGQPEVAPGTFITIALANKKDGPYSTTSKVDYGFRGFFIPKPEITIMIESGVYFEEFPIVIPPNVAIKGDEFRRTLIKPKEGPAPSVNQTIKFLRGDRTLGADYYYNTHYYHQICRVGPASTNPKINVVDATRLKVVSAAYPPKPGMRFIVGASGGSPIVYRVGAASSISYIPQDDNAGIAAGTYIMDIVDDNGDPKPLQNNLGASTAFEFFLDNDHCDMFLVNDAFQARNISFVGSKGFAMAFDPSGQILTRSPYAQVCSTFSATGGGGQLIDGYAGNQVCYVNDFTYTDIYSGAQGASGLKMTVRGLARKPQVPNTFYVEKKKYIIIESTVPDAITGTATLTLSSTTPIEIDDTYLERGFFPNNTTIVIQTAGNRSMLSNDFTMINDLGYGIYVDNNGVCEAVSQFTYYCRVGYLARAGGQVRSVTGSSCYGLIGLQSEGSDPNEAIQIGRLKTNPVNIVTPFIDNALADGNVGAVSFIVGGVDSKPLRNSTFKLNKHEIILSNVARARTLGGSLTTGPIVVTTAYKHPFVTGDEVAMTSIRGLQLPPLTLGGTNRTTDIDGVTFTITVTSATTFTLDTTESTNYVNDLGEYQFADLPARAIANFVTEAQDITYTVKGDPSARNISGYARFDGNLDENTAGQNVLQVFALERPAQIGMKFSLDVTTPVAVNESSTVYTVTSSVQKLVRFRVSPRVVGGSNDNKLGATTLYIKDVTNGWEPVAGWSFQLLDTQIGPEMTYDRYTIINTPTYSSGDSRWVIEINKPLTIPSMVDQAASLEWTRVDGIWDLTLSKDLEDDIPNNATPVEFLFYNSYWSVSIDPALAVALPTTTDSYNKPQAKKFNLYQLKTISIAQIINRPPIVNSSAMRFGASNFDPSIYRILGKTSDGGITTDVYGLAEEAEPLVGYYTSTVAKLLANKDFIKQETIAYLAEIYPDFEYNTVTCARDVGYILDAVAYDLTYGGNVRSRAAGITYYQQGNPSAALVVGQQKAETIDAINFAATVAHTAVNDYSGNSTPQAALPYRGSNLNGVARILANKEFVKEDVIAYLYNVYGGFNYDQEKFATDVGLVLDAVLTDTIFGTNYNTRVAAFAYLRSYNVSTTTSQKLQTIAGLNKARDLAVDLANNSDVQQSIIDLFEVVTDIINAISAAGAPALAFGLPNTTVGLINANAQLVANRSFLIEEIIAFINTNLTPGSIPGYVEATCRRDTGYIIDAIAYDILYGGNSATVVASEAYYNGVINTVGTEISQFTSAFGRLKDIIRFIILADNNIASWTKTPSNTATQNVALTAGSSIAGTTAGDLIQVVIDVVNNGTASAPATALPTYANGLYFTLRNADRVSILNNVTSIQDDVISYLNLTYGSSFIYNPTTCRRDVGLILDAIAYDLEYGGNVKTLYAAYRYYIGTTSANVVLNSQLTETVAALKHAKNIVKLIVLNLEVSEQVGNIESQDLTGTPGVAGVDNVRVENLMTILTNMLEFGLDDVTHPVPPRNLGIRRSYQDPESGSYVGQTINDLLIPEEDSAVRITELMNQISAIVELGPTNRVNLPPPAEQYPEHIIVNNQVIETLQQLVFPATASSLQYGAILTGFGIPGPVDENDSTPATIIRTVTKLYDANENITGYRVKISALITEVIPADTELTVTGPGSDYLFDLNTALDSRHLLGDNVGITTTFSTVRATGHDFLQVGSGGFDDSNYPNNVYGQPVNTPSSGAIVKEVGTGRVFHVSTDEQGNFRVGSYFNVNQGDGSVTIAAKIGLSAVSSLTFLTGETVRQFSADQKMDDNSDNIVPTQKAIKTYITNIIDGRFTVDNTETPQKGLLKLNGDSVMVGQLDLGLNPIENIVNSEESSGSGGVNRKYVDNVFAGGTIDYDGNFGITTTGKRLEVLAFTMATDVTTAGGVAVNKGGIDLNSNKILRVKTPTISTDGASKGYVDQALATGGVRTGWNGFTLNNTTTRYTVTSVNLTITGSGYTTPPAVVFYSTSGVNASARAILAAGSGGRAISSIVVDSGGYGYLAAPTVIIGGSVGTAIVNTSGSGYRATPTITFSAPQITGGVTATGYVIMQGSGINQSISSIVITNAGAGYTAAPNITQDHPGLAPAVAAFLTTSLQAGSGAVATAVVTALPKNIDLNGNKVTGSADPTSGTDLVNWQYFDSKNYIGQTNDVTITGVPSSGDFLVFNGVTPTGSQGAMVNASVSEQSDIAIIRTNNSLSFNYKEGSITNADVATGAGIVQTKLSLNRANATDNTPSANQVGVAAFKASQFTSTDGWVQLKLSTSKTEGVTLDRIQQITNFKILGRAVDGEGTEATGVIQELSSQVVKNLLNLDPSTISGSISDDTLGGLLVSGASSGLSNRSDGSASYGALLKRGGTLRGQVTVTSNGLPADDPVITPIIAVGSSDNEKLDIGTALLRFRKIFGKEHYGLNFYSSADTAVYGKTSAPTTYSESQPVFYGKATFAVKANQVLTGLSGTAVGSGDIQISNGANSVAFDGSQACTISILANAEITNNSIVRRTSGGNIKATTFEGALSGNATTASGILLSSTTYAPTTAATASTTALRDGSGDLYAVVFRGRATTANYADLAENYQADADYAPGTILEFGGEFEVTIAEDETRRVAGVVSTNPAYLMNTDLEGKNVVAIALQGRVPCKVRGNIRKGDMLVSGGGGYARPTTDPKLGTIIGKALENFDGVEGVIEVAVGRL